MRLAYLGFALVAACAVTDTTYVDDWGTEAISTGKADGLLDTAPVLAFNQVGTGYVEGEQLDVYAIDLRKNSTIAITQTVTDGDLAPHFTLYFGGTVHVRSASFNRTTTRIVKTYALTESGRHYIGVKPYQGDGAGRYELRVTCVTGPCTGTDPVEPEPLEPDDAGTCIQKARRCSFDKLAAFNGAVGPARARALFEGCMAESTDERCDSVCASYEGASAVCEDIIKALPFYADQSATCLGVLDSCMADCYDIDGGSADELGNTSEAICWVYGFNGTCDSYARGHAACGGEYAEGTNEQCHALCQSTTGAWTDDLDVLCQEACD